MDDLGLGIAGSVALAVALVAVLTIRTLAPMRDDVAWLLYVAEAWLDGQRPYVELIEVNPPPIIWLSMLPVLVSRALGTSVLHVAPAFFAACLLGCAWLTAGILYRRGSQLDRWTVFTVISTVLLVVPITEFGQREHLIAAAALPFLALRTGSVRASRADGLLAGALVGLCCSVKPHYALPFIAVEALSLLRGRRLAVPAILAALVAWLACLGAALLLTPDYFRFVVPFALELYLSSMHGSLLDRTTAPLILCWAAALLLWLTHRRRLADGGATGVLLAFATGSMLVYAIQGKGWLYQVLPAGIASVLALGTWITTVRPARGWRRAAMPLALLTLFLAGAKAVNQLRQAAQVATAPEATVEAQLADSIRGEGVVSYVAFASTLERGFPVVQMAGVKWASRFPSTWALRAEQQRLEARGTPSAGSVSVGALMVHDFLVSCPGLVAVDEGDPMRTLALLAEADPAFSRAWGRYQPVTRLGNLWLYRRNGSAASRPTGTSACDQDAPAASALTVPG